MNDYINKIIYGNCLEIMPKLQDKCIDLTITSPPYNLGKSINYNRDIYKNFNDRNNKYYKLIYNSLKLMIEKSNIVFFNIQSISKNKIDVINLLYELKKYYKDTIIWVKSNSAPAIQEKVMTSSFEYIYIFSKYDYPEKRKINQANFDNRNSFFKNIIITNVNSENNYSHINSACFPIEIPLTIIKNFSKENDIIMDCFGGMGTTAKASIELKRNYLYIENDIESYEIAKKNIEELKSQLTLF